MKLKKGWEIEVGMGVIDCAIDSTGALIAAGDLNGRTIVSNINGDIVAEHITQMPVWGVDISKELNLLAIGTASKSPSAGELIIVLLNEGAVLLKKKFKSPVWDVKIIENQKIVVASTWNDGLFIFHFDSKKSYKHKLDASLFGLAYDNDYLYFVASSKGIYRLNLKHNFDPEVMIEKKDICYNISIKEKGEIIYAGSSSNTLLRLNKDICTDNSTYSTLSKQVCAVATFNENVITGDLAGNFYINKAQGFLLPLFYQKFNNSIWNVECIQKTSQLFVACGNGFLYNYKIIDSETSYWNFENLPFDESYLKGVKIFINYAKEDRGIVINLYNALTAIGCTPWMDEFNLLPGQNWRFETTMAIKESDFILICLSSRSVGKKGYVQKEIKIALDVIELMPENKVFIIPLRLDECKVPDSLSEWQVVDLYSNSGFNKFIYSIYIDRIKK